MENKFIILQAITASLGPTAILLLILNRRKIRDMFKDKNSFEEAIKAFKSGKSIRRPNNYWDEKYIKREIIQDGKTLVEYGKLRKQGEFSNNLSFDKEDVFANDWIIED